MQRLKLVLTVLCLLLLSASLAFAANAEGGHAPIPWDNFGYRILNLVLVLGTIYYFFGKKIAGFFKGRSQGIASEIASLEERKLEASRHLDAVEKRIANLDGECQAILRDYTAQGEALKAAIIEQAEKAAAQLSESAKRSAENEINAAIEAMRAEMADHIIEATEKLLAKKLSAAEHAKLVDKYLTKVVLN